MILNRKNWNSRIKHAAFELLNDQTMAEKMGNAAKQRVADYFCAAKQAEKYVSAYKEILIKKKAQVSS